MHTTGIKVVVVLIGILCAWSHAASIAVTSPPNTYVGFWSDYMFVKTSEAPNATITITLMEINNSSLDFSTTVLTLYPTTETASFRIRSRDVGKFGVNFTIDGDIIGQFDIMSPITFNSLIRTSSVDRIPSQTVGLPSEPIKISLGQPSSGDLTVTPQCNEPTIQFIPTAIIIPAGSLSGSFVFIAPIIFNERVAFNWTITGAEADLYAAPGSVNVNLVNGARSFEVTDFASSVYVGRPSTTMYLYSYQMANTTVTVTPKAADTTFTPSTLRFSPGAQVVPFTFNTTSPSSAKTVYFFTSGSDASFYEETTKTVNINIPKRDFTIGYPSEFVLTKATRMSVSISAPVVTDITVSFFAANVKFSPTSVQFTATQTSFTVTVTPVALGNDEISFLVSGSDLDYFNTIATQSISVGSGSFIGPNDWYVPALWVGCTSDKLPVRVNIAPSTNVTLTPSSPDLIFTPATLVFTPTTMEQYFTITPAYTNTLRAPPAPPTKRSLSASADMEVTFLVSGGDYSFFNAPSSVRVTVMQRTIQTVWSSHLTDSTTDNNPFNSEDYVRYLQKTYRVWATANFVASGESVTVTPVSTYFSFTPSVFTFTSSSLQIEFNATVTGTVGATNIDYILGGQAGGLYTLIPTYEVTTALRPLAISAAVVAPDNRIGARNGWWVADPSNDDLASNHVFSIALTSYVVPDAGLTITPRSLHVTFNPPSISLDSTKFNTYYSLKTIRTSASANYTFALPNYNILANFSLTPLSAGIHDVWFELSGNDAQYYSPPPHTAISFSMETRPPTEFPTDLIKSSSSRLIPSLVAFALAAVALVLVV